jgi:hypothetical protein
MTPSLALAELRDALKGHDIVASTLGREPGQWVPVRREALATLLEDQTIRPLSIAESEAKREMAGSGEARSDEGDLRASGIEPLTDPATVSPSPVERQSPPNFAMLGLVWAARDHLTSERADNGDGADRTAPQGLGTAEKLILSPAENDDKGFGHLPRPESSAPTPCAECGTPLTLFEIARIDVVKGTKFEALCSDCCYVKLGIAR